MSERATSEAFWGSVCQSRYHVRSTHYWEWPFSSSEPPLANHKCPKLTRPGRRLSVQRRRVEDVPRRQARLESVALARTILERPAGHGARAVRPIGAARE